MTNALKNWFSKRPDLGQVFARFPVAVILMGAFTLLIMFDDLWSSREDIGRVCLGIIIAAYCVVCVVLARESTAKKPSIILQVIIAGVVVTLAYVSEAMKLNLFMGLGGAILMLGNMVIWSRAKDNLHVWDFTHKVWSGAIFATAGSLIFLAGIFAIDAALKNLFSIRIDNLITEFLLPIGLGFLAPLYWLGTIPPVDESYEELSTDPGFVSKAMAFLGTWLLAPLTLIYAAILLAYGVKIILEGSLPRGEIAQLTIPFLFIGTLTWLMLEPPFIQKQALARIFRKLWFLISVPAIFLLGLAAYIRISNYGLTPERVLMALIVIWSLGLSLIYHIRKHDHFDIRWIPSSASFLLVFGAVFAGWISYVSQASRLENNLVVAGVLSETGTLNSDVELQEQEAAQAAKGALQYLLRHDGDAAVARILENTNISPDLMNSENKFELERALSLDDVSITSRHNSHTYFEYYREDMSLNVAGYDIVLGPFTPTGYNEKLILVEDTDFSAKMGKGHLIVTHDGMEIANFDLKEWVMALPRKGDNIVLDAPYITLVDDEDRKIMLVVTRLTVWEKFEPDNEATNYTSKFYLLTSGY